MQEALASEFARTHDLADHVLDAYNDMTSRGIRHIIEGCGPILLTHREYTFKLVISNPRFSTYPTAPTSDNSPRVLTPMQCRQNNLDYVTPLYVDVTFTLSKDGVPIMTDTVTGHEFGGQGRDSSRFPVMIGSNICATVSHANGADEECPFDCRGYFIIGGGEKHVELTRREIGDSTHFVSLDTKGAMSLRLSAKNSRESRVATNAVTIYLKKLASRTTKTAPLCMMFVVKDSAPIIKCPLPVILIFRALGITRDHNIFEMVCGDLSGGAEPPESEFIEWPRDAGFVAHTLASILQESTIDPTTKEIRSREQAVQYIYDKCGAPAGEDRDEFVSRTLNNVVFPNCSTDRTEQARYLAHLVRTYILVRAGLANPDDRDHLGLVRIKTPGSVFEDIYQRSYVKYMVREFPKKLSTFIDQKVREGRLSETSFRTFIGSYLSRSPCSKRLKVLLRQSCGTGGETSQTLKRMSMIEACVSLRKIERTLSRESRQSGPRGVHMSSIGFLCPATTKESRSVGLNAELALGCRISSHTNPERAIQLLRSSEHCSALDEVSNATFACMTKVLVNYRLVGVTEAPITLCREIRKVRRAGRLDHETAVTYLRDRDIVTISTDDGRLLRPLLTMPLHPKLAEMTWSEMIACGAIEYVDPMEVENTLICESISRATSNVGSMSDGTPVSNKYTHCEVDPALLYSVSAQYSPFSHSNQAPRLVYSAGMFKQALAIPSSDYRKRFQSGLFVLEGGETPIVRTRYSSMFHYDKVGSGVNCNVAIGAYSGFNVEDSVVVSRAFVERNGLLVTSYSLVKDETKSRNSPSDKHYTNPARPSGGSSAVCAAIANGTIQG